MPRRPRILIEGGLYHVYNRFARGESMFSDPEEAIAFVELLRDVKQRDGMTILAWAVLCLSARADDHGDCSRVRPKIRQRFRESQRLSKSSSWDLSGRFQRLAEGEIVSNKRHLWHLLRTGGRATPGCRGGLLWHPPCSVVGVICC